MKFNLRLPILFGYSFSLLFLFLFLFLFPSLPSHSQTWAWGRASDPHGSGEGYGIATDPSGNIFICGVLSSSVASFGSQTITAPAGTAPYLVKYDQQGNALWARSCTSIVNPGGCTARAVATDAFGNVFMSGILSGTVSFGTYTIMSAPVGTSSTTYQGFLVKYNAQGVVQWAVTTAGNGALGFVAVSCDPSGNAFVAGTMNGVLAAFGTNTLINSGTTEAFIAKYDASGNCLWAQANTSSYVVAGYGVSCDQAGNAFLCGTFQSSTVSFGSVTFTNSGGKDAYIVKYNSSGTALWGVSSSGANNEEMNFISADPAGDVYCCGIFNGTMVTVGAQTFTAANVNVSKGYVAKFSGSGTPLWTQALSGLPSAPVPMCVSAHPAGVFVTGNLTGTTAVTGTQTITVSQNVENSFFINYDSNGNVLYFSYLPDGGDDDIDIASYGSCHAYVGGDYRGQTFTVGPNVLVNSTSNEGLFVADLSFGANLYASASATISGQPAICRGQSALLQVGGVTNFVWSTGSISNPILVTPSVTTVYTVSGTGACGASTAAITVSVIPYPQITVVATKTQVCQGDYITLTASGANSYTWSGGAVNGSAFQPSVAGIYTVIGSNYGCNGTATLMINMDQYPGMVTASLPEVCAGNNVALTVNGASSVTWQPGGAGLNNYTVTPLATTIYTATAINVFCIKTSTVKVIVDSVPNLQISPSTSVCPGTAVTLTVGGAQSYTWTNNVYGSTYNVTPPFSTVYTVTGIYLPQNGCYAVASVTVSVVNCDGIHVNTADGLTVWYDAVNQDLVFSGSETGSVTIYDLSGRTVCRIHDQELKNRVHVSLATGVYMYTIEQRSAGNIQKGRLAVQQ